MPVPLLGFTLQSIVPPKQAALVSETVALLALGKRDEASVDRASATVTT